MKILAPIASTAGKAAGWIGRRARERSTWTGLAIVATLLGKPGLAAQLGHVADAAGLILGTGLAVASTTPHDPAPAAPAATRADAR